MSQAITLTLRQIEDNTTALAILQSPEGYTEDHQFTLPWLDDKEWNAIFQYLKVFGDYKDTWPTSEETIRSAKELGLARDDGSPSPKRLEIIGKNLYNTIFGNEKIRRLLWQSLNSYGGNTPMFVLHFRDAGRYLQTYPWELLHDGEKFLFDAQGASLVRWIDFGQKSQHIQAIQLDDTLNVLMVDPRPKMPEKYSELPPLDRDVLQSHLTDVSSQLIIHNIESVSFLSTLTTISNTLLPKKIHAIHIDAHGDFGWLCERCDFLNPSATTHCRNKKCGRSISDDQHSQGYLAFQKSNGSLAWVDGDQLGKAIAKNNINLVFLSACDSGLVAEGNVFNSVAGALIKQGVPAVVAMQLPVEVESTKTFVYSFYNALLNYKPLGSAVPFARTSLSEFDDTWYRPVLYLRTDATNIEGRIFEPIGSHSADSSNKEQERQSGDKQLESIEIREPFVPGYEHDIFVSCFRASESWVSSLTQGLENHLETLLGRKSAFSLWKSDDTLSFSKPIPDEMAEAIERTAILVVILSPEYLVSERCQSERQAFLEKAGPQRSSDSRVFIVERTKIEDDDRPREFMDLRNYRFWVEDRERHSPRTFGEPSPDPDKPEDDPYYARLRALSHDLTEELKRLKSATETSGTDKDAPDTRPAIFLAEVSEDIIPQRDEVKQYLDQAGFRVLPEILYFSESEVFQQTVDNILEDCKIFVQLLSHLPGRKPPGRPSYNYLQYECARRAGKPILQWRDPSLKPAAITDEEHRDLLERETVIAVNLEKFKQEIVERALFKPAVKTPSVKAFVFLNANREDRSLAQDIRDVMKARGVACALPLQKGAPADMRKDLEANLLDCDGVIVIYGEVPVTWARAQLRDYLKIRNKREHPMKAFAVYEGPPEPKDPLDFDVPGMYIISYQKKRELQPFLEALKAEGNP